MFERFASSTNTSAESCRRAPRERYALKSLNLSSLDTSKVESMEAVFSHCFSLASLDTSGFDTSSVTEMV